MVRRNGRTSLSAESQIPYAESRNCDLAVGAEQTLSQSGSVFGRSMLGTPLGDSPASRKVAYQSRRIIMW
jgi:hypothetical protein